MITFGKIQKKCDNHDVCSNILNYLFNMNWEQTIEKIRENIKVGTDVNTESSTFRIVLEIPPFQCKQYNNEVGYKVKIGDKNALEIPVSMLKTILENATKNNKRYNTSIFKEAFPRQTKNHGCHVHVVGKLLEKSGIADKEGNAYKIHSF